MAAIEISEITFSAITQWLELIDTMLVSKSMFSWMRIPMVTLQNSYDPWLTRHSKWLPLKPT